MSPKRRPGRKKPDPFAGTGRLRTFGDWLGFARRLYRDRRLAVGQVAASADDEALFLLLRGLDLPLDSGRDVLRRPLTAAQQAVLEGLLRRRAIERIPAAYLVHEAWLGPHRFYVDERAIIPRSYFLELIGGALDECLPAGRPVRSAADVCTGSGCLAIVLAHRHRQARVDAIDLSPAALAVAAINVRGHRLSRRVRLFESDLFDGTPPARYDLIVSNPPYEPTGRVDRLPPEFRWEPRLALDGGRDGMAIVRRLVREAPARLAPGGILAIEVGGLRAAVDREFGACRPRWLPTADGSNCVAVFQSLARS